MPTPALSFTIDVRSDLLPDDQREAVLSDPGFGKTFTDHMVLATWTPGQGWHDAKVQAYGPLSLNPSAAGRRRNPSPRRPSAEEQHP